MYGRTPVDVLAQRLRSGDHATVLFLSDHGAARAVIAEAIFNRFCASGFTAIAAGVEPEPASHPLALEMLRAYRLPVRRRAPADLEEIARERQIDYVIAIWDRASGEPFPLAGRRSTAASWDVADPRRPLAAGAGLVESRIGFVRAYATLRARIARFIDEVNAERGGVSEDERLAFRTEDRPAFRAKGPRAPLPKGALGGRGPDFNHAQPLTLGASMLAPADPVRRR